MMVVKTEKIICMRARLNPLLFFNGRSASYPRIEDSSTIISHKESRLKRVETSGTYILNIS
nr:MAG TPA: hypothetical protein [Bacteriophage sp.]